MGRRIVTSESTPSPTWSADHLRRAMDAAGVALWLWNVDTDAITMDDRAYELWGISKSGVVTFEDLSAHIHPADQGRVRAGFSATRALTGPYEIDFRISHQDDIRWISVRGQGNDAGIVGAVMSGIFLDVTGRKQAEEAHELLAGEMSHRVKNLLTIASALTTLTSRSAATTAEMARDLTHRLTALGRAHDLVRPLPGQEERGALLGDLISVLLAPYDDLGTFTGRVRVSVPKIGVGENTATTLALVIHELATNSLNTERCRWRPACSTCPAPPTAAMSWSCGRSAAVPRWWRPWFPQGSEARCSSGACRGSSAGPSRSTGRRPE